MNPPHHPNDVVVHMNTGTSTVGISSSSSNSNHNINSHVLTNSYKMSTRTLSSCMHPSIYDSEHESGQVSSPTATLSFLSSSPTDVLLLSSSRAATAAAATTRFQQSPPSSSSLSTSSSNHPSAWPTFPMSQKAQRTQNPIRAILDPILQVSNHSSSNNFENSTKNRLISLALGDPIAATEISLMNASASTDDHDVVASTNDITTSPLLPCPHAIRAVLGTLQSASSTAAASYSPAIGTIEGRRAIAQYHSHSPYYTYDPESDVIVANGCSGALELLLTSLLDQPTHTVLDQHHHSILLVPAPGFPLYRVIAESHGATVLSYPLLPEQQWEVDLVQLQNIMEQHQRQFYDHHTGSMTTTIRGIVINNPSNPTGAVYTTTHLQQIVHLCQQYCIPIIADEIYGDLIFPTRPLPTNPMYLDKSSDPHSPKFVSVAQIAAQMGRIVPVITASGIGKQFLLPGWRIGWICFQDKYVLSYCSFAQK
jgi:tyrosine aminotransferase